MLASPAGNLTGDSLRLDAEISPVRFFIDS